jgi:hypothetical protein
MAIVPEGFCPPIASYLTNCQSAGGGILFALLSESKNDNN